MASTFTELKKGAKGNNVVSMQNALKNAGYNVGNTGTFDDLTESALRQYQQSKGLTVDGVAGDQTLSSLYNMPTASSPTTYAPSASVMEAQKYLEAQQNMKPGEYKSSYSGQLQGLLDRITNREPFQYDANADPLYQIYKDQYIMNGRRAMQDTIGQAVTLTGGYGNSYAQSVGQQQYNQYMEGLNAMVPELSQMAYERYADEGDNLARNYQLLNQADQQAYDRYRDAYADWQTELQLAQQGYENAYARDYNAFADQRAYDAQVDQFNRNFDFQQSQFDYTKESDLRDYEFQVLQANRNYELQQAQLALQQAQFDWQKAQAAAKRGGGGSGSRSGGSGSKSGTAASTTSAKNGTDPSNWFVRQYGNYAHLALNKLANATDAAIQNWSKGGQNAITSPLAQKIGQGMVNMSQDALVAANKAGRISDADAYLLGTQLLEAQRKAFKK